MDCELKSSDIWMLTARVGGYRDTCINDTRYKVEEYVKQFVASKFFTHLKDFDKYGKLTVAFYWWLMNEQIGIYQECGHHEQLSERCFEDRYYRGWVAITTANWRKVKDCLAMVGVSWDKDTQNTTADLVAFLNGTYKAEKQEKVEQDLFTSVVLWKEVCKKLKKSKEYDEMNEEVQEQVVEEQVMVEKNEEQAVKEQMEQTVEVQAQEEPVVEEKVMEEREEFSEKEPVVEDKQQRRAASLARYKEKKEQDRVDTANAIAMAIRAMKDAGTWETLCAKDRDILIKHSTVNNDNSIVAKLFGREWKVGDSITLGQAFRLTMKGKAELDKKFAEWEQKNGVKVEYKEDLDDVFNSTYTIVEC